MTGISIQRRTFVRLAYLLVVGLFVAAAGASPSRAEEQGVTNKEIVIGMSNALTGPAAALGTGVKAGAMTYFRKINNAGGVNGRKIKVISYDDGYEPERTVENTNKLINEDKVFALFGYVGTPTSAAVLPIVNKSLMLFWGPFTGAELLRTPVTKNIFNVRGSYDDEAEMQVKYLTEKLGKKKIGVFIQNDAYGLSVKFGVVKALKKRNLEIMGEGTYERNTENVDAGLAAIKPYNPDAVVMVGTYKAMAAFIKKAKAQGFNPVFLNVSFVGTAALVKELAGEGDGVIVTQVMPSPYDSPLPLVRQYRQDMKAAGHSELDYTDLEGYVDAVVFVEVLKNVAGPLTRESFIATAEKLNATVGGLTFTFTAGNHQAMSKIYLTKIAGSKVSEF
ncbi:MAG TPA: ABC transporter substrate-binding protein [Nitrospirota bacterium]|nr:ABC transporter substrate-binding protein [Nitrospirota bacterium]